MPSTTEEKQKVIESIIEGLEVLRDDARAAVESLKAGDAYPQDFDPDDAFDCVLDILSTLDHELKNA